MSVIPSLRVVIKFGSHEKSNCDFDAAFNGAKFDTKNSLALLCNFRVYAFFGLAVIMCNIKCTILRAVKNQTAQKFKCPSTQDVHCPQLQSSHTYNHSSVTFNVRKTLWLMCHLSPFLGFTCLSATTTITRLTKPHLHFILHLGV